MKTFGIHSFSLNHTNRYFLAPDLMEAKSIIRDRVYSCQDYGLLYGIFKDDLHLFDIDTNENIPLSDIPGISDFVLSLPSFAKAQMEDKMNQGGTDGSAS